MPNGAGHMPDPCLAKAEAKGLSKSIGVIHNVCFQILKSYSTTTSRYNRHALHLILAAPDSHDETMFKPTHSTRIAFAVAVELTLQIASTKTLLLSHTTYT